MKYPSDALKNLMEFPLLTALFGRRARRFGMGMKIPSGPLAYQSKHKAKPLSELEESILIAAGTGVSGWNFGVPYGPDRSDGHAHYTNRFTGRTFPTAGGFGTPMLLYTNDNGCFMIPFTKRAPIWTPMQNIGTYGMRRNNI